MRDRGRGSSSAAITLGSRFAPALVAAGKVVFVVPGGGLSSSSRIEPEARSPLFGASGGGSGFGLRYSGEDGSRIGLSGSFFAPFWRKMRSNKEA